MPADESKLGIGAQQGDASRAPWQVRVLRLVVRGIFVMLFRVRVRGLQHLPEGRAIICANHMSWADPFLVILFFPLEPRIYALADSHAVSRTGFRATMMHILKIVVPLDPNKPLEAMRTMEDVVKRGGSLVIFPEGAPTPDPQEGALREMHPGATYLSALTGVPLVPVAIGGTSALWLRRRIYVRAGRPLDPRALAAGDRRAQAAELLACLDAEISSLLKTLPRDDGPRVRLLQKWLTNLFA